MRSLLSNLPIVNVETTLKFIVDFYNDLVSHSTFDTLFKKLFHTDSQSYRIDIYKQILNLYFLWEHFESVTSTQEAKGLNEKSFKKEAKIDKRYDALIAGLLKPEYQKLELFCKVNFITWNYDLNLISSVKNFYFSDYPYGDLLKIVKEDDKVWNIQNEMKIINMNGYFYSSFLDPIINYHNAKPAEYIKDRLLEVDALINGKDKGNAGKITFAWEKKSMPSNSNVVDKAKEAIEASDIIVVIGYSFPLYNRLIDFEYFNGTTLGNKTLYIQDLNAIEMVESLKSDFSIHVNTMFSTSTLYPIPDEKYTEIKPIVKCDSFFIPNSIFKYKDTLGEL
jgi:hypothetical protein